MRQQSRGWSLEVAPAPKKAARRKNNNEDQAAISNHPDAFLSSPFCHSFPLSAESSAEEAVSKAGKMERCFPFSRKMSQYICHLCFQGTLVPWKQPQPSGSVERKS